MKVLRSYNLSGDIATLFLWVVVMLLTTLLLLNCTVPIQPTVIDNGTTGAQEPTASDSALETTSESATPLTPQKSLPIQRNQRAMAEQQSHGSMIPKAYSRGSRLGSPTKVSPTVAPRTPPIVMYEYSDFQCPFCGRYFVQTEAGDR